nr:copia protein [Tanacetum cinerariifolium]
MIPEPGDTNREVPVNETFHVQTDDELTEKEVKQIKADDQAIQTILLGLPEDIYATDDSCETAQEIWLRVRQMMKGSDIGIQEKKAKLFNELERFASNEGESIESYYHCFLKLMNDLKRNKHFLEKIASNLKFLNNLQPKWSRHKEVDELKAERLVKTQDPLALMATSNNPYSFPVLNQDQPSFNQNYMQQPMPNPEDIIDPTNAMNMNVRNQVAQNPRVQNVGNQNALIGVPRNANQNGNGNLVAARAEGNTAGHNGNQIRCYNCRRVVDLDEIEEVNANYILMANLQQASTSSTQTDKAPVYDSDGSAEYAELLDPFPEPHQVPQNDNNVIYEVTSVEQSGETVEQHPINIEETRALYDSLYQNLAIEVDKVNSISRKLKETNADLTTELARFKNQEKFFEISQEKYDKLERCHQHSVYQEQCLSKKINALHLSSGKQIMTLNEELLDLNKQLSKEKSIVSFLLEEKKKLKSDFKIREDKLLDKQIQLEKKIKELNNILVKTEETLQLAQESREKMKQLKKEIKPANYIKINYLSGVSDQKDNKSGTSANTKFAKQSIMENLPKVGETHALSKPVTLNLVPTPQESKVVKNDKVIAPGMFRINPFKTSREEKHVPNTVRASARTKPIAISQPPVITKKDFVNSDSNGLSSTGIDNTKTRRPQPRSNTKNDRVSSESKSSRSKNKGVENVISKVVCAMCKQCLIFVNHDVCLCNYVNGKTSRGKKQTANVSIKEKQKKHQPKVKKTKKVGFIKRLATPKPRKSRFFLRWSPTGRLFDLIGKIIESSESEIQSDCSNGDNACTSNTLEPKIKRFPNSTSLLGRVYFVEGLGHNLFSVGQFCDSNLEAEAIATACFTQNHSIIHRHFNKTPYELINERKPDISCYPKNDREDIGKLSAKEDVYMCQPEGFIDVDHPSHVYKLKKALYGLKQAPRAWYDELSTFLLQNHFFKGTIDPTLFIRRFHDDILVVHVYVDDIIFGSTHPRYIQLFSDLMKSRFEMSMMEEMTFFLGLQVNQSPSGIFINQSKYMLEILKKYGMESCDPIGTPMEIKYKFDLDQNGTPVDATKYRSMIGVLMYLTSSSPDIVHATCLCAQYQAKPTEKHLKLAAPQRNKTEHVEKGTIELYFVKMDYQQADLFTKALPVDRFNYLVRRLGIRSLSPQELDHLVKSQ